MATSAAVVTATSAPPAVVSSAMAVVTVVVATAVSAPIVAGVGGCWSRCRSRCGSRCRCGSRRRRGSSRRWRSGSGCGRGSRGACCGATRGRGRCAVSAGSLRLTRRRGIGCRLGGRRISRGLRFDGRLRRQGRGDLRLGAGFAVGPGCLLGTPDDLGDGGPHRPRRCRPVVRRRPRCRRTHPTGGDEGEYEDSRGSDRHPPAPAVHHVSFELDPLVAERVQHDSVEQK